MSRKLVVVVLWLVSGCSEPAHRFEDEFRQVIVPTEFDIRSQSYDLLAFATAHWRFYDDYLDLQPAACGDDSDGGVPNWPYLWRHGLESSRSSFPTNGRNYGGRSGLDVSRFGMVVVQAEDRLWTLALDGGVPLHADLRTPRGGGMELGAFATDTLFWTSGSYAPAVFDFSLPRDRGTGWQVTYAWRDEHSSTSGFDIWYQPTASVLRDGTLIWSSGAGFTRALTPRGEVKWETEVAEGVMLVTPDDVVVRSANGDFFALGGDGGVRWHEPTLNGVPVRPLPMLDEGRLSSRFLPMMYVRQGEELLVVRDSSTGTITATQERDGGAAFPLPEVIALDQDGWLFEQGIESSGEYALAALNPLLQQVWRVPSRQLEFAPIVSASGRRLVTIDDCRVNLIDRDTGATLASHRLLGLPTRFLPRLFDGILYVTAEIRPTAELKPSDMQGRLRPDGGVIDVAADYGCFNAFYVDSDKCPRITSDLGRAMYAVYAFRVE